MNTLFEIEGKLRNGDVVKSGDVVMVEYGPYYSILKIYESEGFLMVKHFMYGETTLANLDKYAYRIKKITPVEVYKFCKKNQWNTKEYISLFKA